MAVNYDRLRALAERLIEENGRVFIIRKLDSTPDDAGKPWRGNSEPRETPDDEITCKGVMMDTISSRYLGLLTKRQDDSSFSNEKVLIVAATSSEDKEVELYDEVVDEDGELWSIEDGNVLQPGSQRMIASLLIRKKGIVR